MNQAAQSDLAQPNLQKLPSVTDGIHDETPDVHAVSNRPSVVKLLNLTDLGSADDQSAVRGAALNATPAANAVKTAGGSNNPLHHIKTRLTICVGAAEVTVGELLGAHEQQVLRLDRTIDQAVDILLEGQVVARGVLVAVDEYFGVRITELPIALTA